MSTASSLRTDNVRFSLEAVKGPHKGLTFESDKTSITIGRGPENDIVLTDDPRVSRQHAEIKQSLGQFYLVNLSQKNFVLLNNQNITSEKIDNKSVIQVGETEFKFIAQGSTNLLEPVSPVLAPVPTPAPPSAMSGIPSVHAGGVPSVAPPPPPPGYGRGPAPQAPPPGYGAAPARPYTPPSGLAALIQHPKFKVYFVVALVGLLGFYMLKGGKTRKVEDRPFRTSEELEVSRTEAENEIKQFQERKDKMKIAVYQKAYENFLRGYRDYRQGQYARAREAFQLVLNLDPENELARRYFNLAKIRFDELIKFNMLQGRRYLEKQNYRMCRSNFQTVMTMLGNDPSNPEYVEAKTYHEQCNTALEGRY